MIRIVDETGVQPFGVDNTNVPAPIIDENHVATTPASLTLRQEFLEYSGTYVIHCHRLNHEDNGLMALINVIPEVSTYAVAIPGGNGKPASVQVRDGNGDKVLQTVFPFPDFEGTPSVAMADVNGDQILDLVVGTGKGASPEVVAYDGNNTVDGAVQDRAHPFRALRLGLHRRSDRRGRGHRRKCHGRQHHRRHRPRHGIAGEGVLVAGYPDESGKAPDVFSTFTPYPGSKAGVALATGMVEAGSGRESIVTAPGPGDAPLIKSFRWDLFTPTARAQANGTATQVHSGKPTDPKMTSQFLAYDESYKDGVALSTGWVAGAEGGAKSIVTGQLGGGGHRAGVVERVTARRAAWHLPRQPEPPRGGREVRPDRVVRAVPRRAPRVSRWRPPATTYGADLLVAGMAPGGQEVRKYTLERPTPDANTVAPKQTAVLPMIPGVPRSGSVGRPLGKVPDHPGDQVEHHGPECKGRSRRCRCRASCSWLQAYSEADAARVSVAG